MALKDLSEILADGHRLPIRGKTYFVPSASAEAGIRFQGLLTVAARAKGAEDYKPSDDEKVLIEDAAELDLVNDVLGAELVEEMKADGLPYEHLRTCAFYSLLHATQGEDVAERFWESGGKAPAPNRAARRTATRTRTAAASTTRKRA